MMSKTKKYGIYRKFLSFFCTLIVLLGYIPFTAITFTTTVSAAEQDDEVVVVSLGDSFSSGEGIEKFYGQDEKDIYKKAENQDWLAHRSENSWPGQLKFEGLDGTLADHKNTNWYFFATSGAETKHMEDDFKKEFVLYEGIGFDGIHYYEDYNYVDAQLDSLRKVLEEKKEIDYVTLTLGGNDAKFTEVVTEAVVSSFTLDPNKTAHMLNNIWANFYMENGIRDNLRDAYEKIYEASGGAKIIVAGYPKLIDKNGGIPFSPEVANLVNDSVTRFNNEIEALVNSCKADGMKICFVSVEEKFEGKEAYTNDAYLNNIKVGPRDQELNERFVLASAYSMHPNKKGAKLYAECVQDKIDDIEKDGGKSEWPEMSSSDERDVVLVLDTSGSMSGTPLNETKKAAEKFIDTVMNVDASVGIVTYDSSAMKVSNFNKNHAYLRSALESLNSGGQTNIEAGLSTAYDMLQESNAKKKIIVLMSDGEPNTGKTGQSLIDYSNEIKNQGIYIYTLGFFSELSYKYEAQQLMESIASTGCHYEVDNAESLVYFFGDIADQIQGTKYIYIRIACPVDVEVEYDGEKLSSKDVYTSQRTSFGTLTFEENLEETDESTDNRIKILRLREGTDYDIHIEGNGKGKMNYTIGFMDDEGEYSDMREFEKIKITKKTEIDTVAARKSTTILKVDEDGDGSYDLTYKANENSNGELVDYSYLYYAAGAVILLIFLFIAAKIIKTRKAKTKAKAKKENAEKNKYIPPVYKPVNEITDDTPPASQPAAENTAPKFCPKCGQENPGSSTFCPYCGVKFDKNQ